MALKALGLLATGAAIGVTADRVAMELRKPAPEQFPWLRLKMKDTINPWLMDRGIPGSAKAEIATLEHVGRTSGTTYFTPIHPTIRERTLLIPVPLGSGSQWARNVLKAGHARMQFHETLYELDSPELITVTEAGTVPPRIAGPVDQMGWRYLRTRVAAIVPGTFATHASSIPAAPAGGQAKEAPLEGTFDIPVEPRMVERKVPIG